MAMKATGSLLPGLHWHLATGRRLLWAPEAIRARLIERTIAGTKQRPEIYADLPTRREVA